MMSSLDLLPTGRVIDQPVIMWIALMMVMRSCRLGVELTVREVASGGGLAVALYYGWQHLVHGVASRHATLHVTLVRDPRQLGQCSIVTGGHFPTPVMLGPVYVMDVPGVLVSAAPTPRTCLVLVDLSSVIALSVHGVTAANGPTRMVLSINQRHSRYRILLIVIAILVPSLDQLLFRLFETEGAHQAITIVRNIDIGHVPRVIHARLSLQMMTCLVD